MYLTKCHGKDKLQNLFAGLLSTLYCLQLHKTEYCVFTEYSIHMGPLHEFTQVHVLHPDSDHGYSSLNSDTNCRKYVG